MRPLSRLFGAMRRRRAARVVILPFESSQPSLGTAMADGVIELLARSAALDVVGPASARAAGGGTLTEADEDALGAELLVRGVVTIDEVGVAVSVTAVRSPGGTEAWSAEWHGTELEIFGIQASIAQRIATTAGVDLPTPGDALIHREPTADLAAYTLHGEGRDLLLGREGPDVAEAVERFEAALEADALYAHAWASIAEAHRVASDLGLAMGLDAPDDAVPAAAERALELDDTLPDAHVSVGYAEMRAWRLAEAEAHIRLAIELAPGHAEAHRWLARCLVYRGDFQAAIGAAERAVALEPLSSPIVNESGWPYALAGRAPEALERSRRVIHRDPEYAMAYFHLGRYAELSGRAGEAITYFRAAAELSGRVPFLTAFLGMSLIDSGDRQEAEDIAHDLERKARRGSPIAACLGALLVRLGRHDDGLGWLETALAARDPLLLLADTHWLPLSDVRGDPRFKQLIEALPKPTAAGRRPSPDR